MVKLRVSLSLFCGLVVMLIASMAGAQATNTFPSSGNVGIGTTSPAATLDVSGTAQISGKTVLNATSGRPIIFDPEQFGTVEIQGDSGGWAFGLNAVGYSGTNLGGFGFFGTANTLNYYYIGNAFSAPSVAILPSGNVGIGTTSPAYSLDVAGIVHTSTAVVFPDGSQQTTAWTGTVCGGDYAESVDVIGRRKSYEPGDVLVIDPDAPGKFLESAEPYSTSVAGIYSTKPGLVGRREGAPKNPDAVPMAMVGIVPTKVDAENGPIRPGDLLVTSSTLGYAMKGTDRSKMLGAVIGKALGSLDSGKGVVEVVVMLQ